METRTTKKWKNAPDEVITPEGRLLSPVASLFEAPFGGTLLLPTGPDALDAAGQMSLSQGLAITVGD